MRIQLLGGLGWRTVALATTGGDGSWSASVPTGRSRVFRAVFPGDPAHTAARSAQLGVAVRPQLAASVAARRVRLGRAIVVTGAVRPRKPRLRLFVERQSGRALRPFATQGIGAVAGRFRTAVRLRRPGLYRLRVAFRGDKTNVPVTAPELFVRVVR